MYCYEVVKPGLKSTGWIGLLVDEDRRKATLRFPNGEELTYKKTSLSFEGRGGDYGSPPPDVVDNRETGRSFIVVKLHAGKGTRPNVYKVHDTEDSAREEAIRLANLNPNEAFKWLEVKGTVVNRQVVTETLEIF